MVILFLFTGGGVVLNSGFSDFSVRILDHTRHQKRLAVSHMQNKITHECFITQYFKIGIAYVLRDSLILGRVGSWVSSSILGKEVLSCLCYYYFVQQASSLLVIDPVCLALRVGTWPRPGQP